MKIVWDEPKRRSNLATHGFDLADAELIDWEKTWSSCPVTQPKTGGLGFGPLPCWAMIL